jgi:hypothetical protein
VLSGLLVLLAAWRKPGLFIESGGLAVMLFQVETHGDHSMFTVRTLVYRLQPADAQPDAD